MFCRTTVSKQNGLQAYETVGACLTTQHNIPEVWNLQETLCIPHRMQSHNKTSHPHVLYIKSHSAHWPMNSTVCTSKKARPFPKISPHLMASQNTLQINNAASNDSKFKRWSCHYMVSGSHPLTISKAQVQSTCNKVSPHLTLGSHSKNHNTHSV
jgi:hypothetical protein